MSFFYALYDYDYLNAINSRFQKTHFVVGYDTQKNSPAKQKSSSSTKIYKEPSTKAYFTTVHDVRKELEACIKSAKKNISIAIFAFTDKKVADLLIEAHKSNIKVTVITDRDHMNDRYSKIGQLVDAGIAVFYYDHELNPNPRQKRAKNAIMHHKFTIIDDTLLIFGSLNLTKAAQEENIENIAITKKQNIIQQYQEEFDRLRSLSKPVRWLS